MSGMMPAKVSRTQTAIDSGHRNTSCRSALLCSAAVRCFAHARVALMLRFTQCFSNELTASLNYMLCRP